ncbi:hypothetical protein [Massilia sp. CT11-137]|uniref:hypothetical protein n=1 Tax=Massilia sp. CT11-137 TaxID=3393901 RepID=UPI0039AEB1D0
MPWGYAAAAVGTYLAADSQKDAASSAANASTQASQAGIDEQHRQFDQVQKLLSPYVNAGTGALGAQQNLLGTNGTAAQQAAISGIQTSPQYQALSQSGQDAILANASATGGLRGGNVQAALGQFQPQLLAQLIDQQYSRLGGMTSLGQNAAAGVGNAGLATGNNVTQLLGQQGSAQAGAALANGRANGQLINGLTNTFGAYLGGTF